MKKTTATLSKQPTRIEIMEKIAKWLAAGVERGSTRDKTITRLCGSWRVWTHVGERQVQVGMHGKGKSVVVEKRKV